MTTTISKWVKASERPDNAEKLHWRRSDTKEKIDISYWEYFKDKGHVENPLNWETLEFLEEKEVFLSEDIQISLKALIAAKDQILLMTEDPEDIYPGVIEKIDESIQFEKFYHALFP